MTKCRCNCHVDNSMHCMDCFRLSEEESKKCHCHMDNVMSCGDCKVIHDVENGLLQVTTNIPMPKSVLELRLDEIDRRLNCIEKWILKEDYDERITDIENIQAESRLIKLEELAQERAHLINYKSYTDLSDRIEKLEKENKKLRLDGNLCARDIQEDFGNKLKQIETEINIVRALGSRAFHPKRPHECPVCEGKGLIFLMMSITESHQAICQPCEGKGIVWG